MSVERHAMRSVMGHFATGVSVVSTGDAHGRPVATTVNALSSLSLDPPLLLVCLARDSETLAALAARGRFAVNVLGQDQREHSTRFAAKGAEARAHEVDFALDERGVPFLPGALATLACRLHATHDGGDHTIVVGEVLALGAAEDAHAPLLFFKGSYSRMAELEPVA
ncbi:MAG TPA: flavin reductase family protein [Solirubrobacteraceae bacterium]|jgi:flavin reductase (DIM6/NTAB) family NADH-FMN oxidoreductase RutF|nr:flavin reductase family protein [Solirubrobacteraceae bacterium]